MELTNGEITALNIFIAFAKEERTERDHLLRQMNLVKVRERWNIWAAHEIKAGDTWNEEIKERLSTSQVVILLMSSAFFNSEYIEKVELPAIIKQHREGYSLIVPVLVKQCHWKDTDFGDYAKIGTLQALPVGEKPIVSKGWDSEDEPYAEVVAGIKKTVKAWTTDRQPPKKRVRQTMIRYPASATKQPGN